MKPLQKIILISFIAMVSTSLDAMFFDNLGFSNEIEKVLESSENALVESAKANNECAIQNILQTFNFEDLNTDCSFQDEVIKAIDHTHNKNCLRRLFAFKARFEKGWLLKAYLEIKRHFYLQDLANIIAEYVSTDSLTVHEFNEIIGRAVATCPIKILKRGRPDRTHWEKLMTAIKSQDISLALSLQENKTPLYFRDQDEKTALHHAASLGLDAVVHILILNGAPLEARDKRGETALMLAAKGNRVSMVKLLLKQGANPKALDSNRKGSIDKTICKPVLELLFAYERSF